MTAQNTVADLPSNGLSNIQMDRFHRYYAAHAILSAHRLPVRRAVFEDKLECAASTVRRILPELRSVGAPIEYVRGEGDRYAPHIAFELPGIWFTPGTSTPGATK